jgi:hypothetical protein
VNNIEKLAAEIAFLSNDSLQKLAQELVVHYATRADVLETKLGAAFFDNEVFFGGEILNG